MRELQLWDSTWPERLMLTFAHFLWQGALIAGVAVICGVMLERASSRVRYNFLLLMLALLMACPAFTFALMESPSMSSVTWEPALLASNTMDHATGSAETATTSLGTNGISLGGEGATDNPSANVFAEVKEASLTGVLSAQGRQWRWVSPYGLIAYLCGVAILLVRLAIGLHGGWRLRQASQPPVDREWLAMIDRQVRTLKLKCAPAVLFCGEVAVPTVIGFFRPTILLPLSLSTGFPMDQVQAILTHELGHIRRWDHAVNVLQRIVESLLFFHPAVWWISHKVRVERELCCDDLVLQTGTAPEIYVRSLLDVAESGLRHRLPAGVPAVASLQATGSGKQSQIASRVRRLLGIRQQSQMRLTPVGTVSFVVAILLAIGTPLFLYSSSSSADAQVVTDGGASDSGSKAVSPHGLSLVDSETGKPVSGAKVTVQRVIRSARGTLEEYLDRTQHTSDASGKVSFMIGGEVGLFINVYIDHRDYATFNAPLRLGETRLELTPAEHVSGSFVSSEGRPVADVQLLSLSATSRTGRSSYYRAVSDKDGRFSVNVAKGGNSVLYVLPKNHAAQLMVTTGRDDLGKIELKDGVPVSGQVLDVRGQPVPDAWVNINNRSLTDKAGEQVIIAAQFGRSAKTDGDGRFTIAPLAANEYEVRVERNYGNLKGVLDRKFGLNPQLPAVFAKAHVTVQPDVVPQPLRLQAVPHVQVEAKFFRADGDAAPPVPMDISDVSYTDNWRGDLLKESAKCLIPHGADAVLHFRLPPDEAVRYRLTKGGELMNVAGNGRVPVGSVTDDLSGLEIVRYESPTVSVEVVDEDDNQIEGDVIVSGIYPSGTQPIYISTSPPVKSDVRFRKSRNGRFGSGGLLPDEELIVHARAAGYETGTKSVRLPEGEKKYLKIVLKRKP